MNAFGVMRIETGFLNPFRHRRFASRLALAMVLPLAPSGMTGLTRRAGIVVAVSVLLAACDIPPPQTLPDPAAASRMSLEEAKEIIQRAHSFVWQDGATDHDLGVWEFTPSHIDGYTYHRDGSTQVEASCPYEAFTPYEVLGGLHFAFGAHKNMPAFDVHLGAACSYWTASVASAEEADRAAAALLRWKLSTPAERQPYLSSRRERFAPIAQSYRAAQPKPVISEDVHRLEVLAEEAVKQERFNEAADDFEDALKLAPWWPEGHYNLALIFGEMHYYDEAIEHMEDVLALVPDAPNARQWQDQIYRWQGESRSIRGASDGHAPGAS